MPILEEKNDDLMSKMENNDLNFFINHTLKGKYFKNRVIIVFDLVVSGELFGDCGKETTTKFLRKEV